MIQRRDVLKLALGGVGTSALLSIDPLQADQSAPPSASSPPAAAAASPASTLPTPPASADVTLAAPLDFKVSTPADLARQLAKQPFKAIGSDLPDPFKNLSNELYSGIVPKAEARIWANQQTGFIVEPLHRGFQYSNPIQINLVDAGKSYRVVYETRLFEFGKLNPSPRVGDIGFSGFRLSKPRPGGVPAEIATFQGTNFYRAVAAGQAPGLMARALALKVADPKGEEMPYFRQIWIEKPSAVADLVVLHAVIDSDSLTGAFRFTVRPGEATIIDIECTLFARTNVDNYGLASMSATHLLGYIDHKRIDDYRPNVSEVGGLQMLTGANEWVWRPVSNRDELQISTFIDAKPHGFGCMIRDRNFESYLDEEQHWERRPSLWIEPLGDWADGGVQLIEIPSQSDANDNILCFWRPKAPLAGGSETSFAYRQFWCWDPPERPPLARAIRSHAGSLGKRTRFFIEFEGDILSDEKRMSGLTPTLTASNGSLTMVRTFTDRDRKLFRVLFELDPQGAGSSELRLVLEAQGNRISETWLFRWTPS